MAASTLGVVTLTADGGSPFVIDIAFSFTLDVNLFSRTGSGNYGVAQVSVQFLLGSTVLRTVYLLEIDSTTSNDGVYSFSAMHTASADGAYTVKAILFADGNCDGLPCSWSTSAEITLSNAVLTGRLIKR